MTPLGAQHVPPCSGTINLTVLPRQLGRKCLSPQEHRCTSLSSGHEGCSEKPLKVLEPLPVLSVGSELVPRGPPPALIPPNPCSSRSPSWAGAAAEVVQVWEGFELGLSGFSSSFGAGGFLLVLLRANSCPFAASSQNPRCKHIKGLCWSGKDPS